MMNKVLNLEERNKMNKKKGNKITHQYDIMIMEKLQLGNFVCYFPHLSKAHLPRRHLQYPNYTNKDNIQLYDPDTLTWNDGKIVEPDGFFIFRSTNAYAPVYKVKIDDHIVWKRADHIRKKFWDHVSVNISRHVRRQKAFQKAKKKSDQKKAQQKKAQQKKAQSRKSKSKQKGGQNPKKKSKQRKSKKVNSSDGQNPKRQKKKKNEV